MEARARRIMDDIRNLGDFEVLEIFQALEKVLRQRDEVLKDPLFYAGREEMVGESGLKDAASKHDLYIYGRNS
jgi:hypothetical protein